MLFFSLFRNSNYFFKKKTNEINFFSGGGGGGNKKFQPFFGKEPNDFINLNLLFFISSRKNSDQKFLFRENENNTMKKSLPQEIIVKNCENIPENTLCRIYEDLFYQGFFFKYKNEKISKVINEWYRTNNDRFSSVKKTSIYRNKEKIHFFFQISEPKVKSLKIVSAKNNGERMPAIIKHIRTKLFSEFLGISFGKMLKFDSSIWNRIRFLEGIKSIDFSINDQDLGDYGNFLDVTLKLEKIRSLAIEPEITLVNNQISSSVSFSENNFLGTGISLKQKIFFRKFNPYYMRFEFDNKNIHQFKRFQLFGKYLKNYFSVGSVLKYFPTNNKAVYIKLGMGLEFCLKKDFGSIPLSPLQFSSTFFNVKNLKDHSFVSYVSMEKFSKTIDIKSSMIFNSKVKPAMNNFKLNGAIIFIENRFTDCISGKIDLNCHKNNVLQYKTKKAPRGSFEKSISLNTLISKNLKFFLTIKYLFPHKKPLSCYKKIEMRCELGKLISFSWHFNNFGKFRTIMG